MVRYQHVVIESVGYVLPNRVVTSEELEDSFAATLQRLGMPRGQIEKLSGVRERRYWELGTTPSSVSAVAAERALAKAGMTAAELQVVVNASVSRDYLEPATAAMVSGHLGVGHDCLGFDVGNACVGFLNGLMTLANMIELGQVDNGIVVAAETISEGMQNTLAALSSPDATIQTFRDHFASCTLGCAAVAFVLKRAESSKSTHRLNGAVWRTATEHNTLCLAQHAEMIADSHGLLVHGVALAAETWPYAVEAFGWGPDSVDYVIGHQVSLAHHSAVFQRIEMPIEKALMTLPYLGNCGPCSLPVTLAIAEAQGQLNPGHELCLYAVGSGLGVVIMGVTW